MHAKKKKDIPVGTLALIQSKYYYGVLSKMLEGIEVERYFSVLYFLNTHNGCTQQFICNHLATDKTAMVKVMDYLLKCKYVERKVNPSDKREHRITLTKKGMIRTKEISRCFEEIDKAMFEGIEKTKIAVFMEVLAKSTNKLKQMPSNDLFFNYKPTAPKNKKKKNNN